MHELYYFHCITFRSDGVHLSVQAELHIIRPIVNCGQGHISKISPRCSTKLHASWLLAFAEHVSAFFLRLFFCLRLSTSHPCQHSPSPVHRRYTLRRLSPAHPSATALWTETWKQSLAQVAQATTPYPSKAPHSMLLLVIPKMSICTLLKGVDISPENCPFREFQRLSETERVKMELTIHMKDTDTRHWL